MMERAMSGSEAGCSRPQCLSLRRLHSTPASLRIHRLENLERAASSRSSAVAVDVEDRILLEPQSELLRREILEAEYSSEYIPDVAKFQELENLKGELSVALQDLEDTDSETGFSEFDWHRLDAARKQHLKETTQLDREAAEEKERRKKQRAAKRAARNQTNVKAEKAARADTDRPAKSPSPLIGKRASRMAVRGARAAALTRSQGSTKWGRPAVVTETQTTVSQSDPAFQTYGDKNSSLAAYMKHMPQHKLLTAEEEVALSKLVKDLMRMEKAYVGLRERLQRAPNLQEWAAAHHQDVPAFQNRLESAHEARTRMMVCNQRLVISIAKRYQNRGLEMSDLIQEGMSGLLRGVEKFDHNRGLKLSTYATWWVRQSITRAISELSRLIRLPAHLSEMLGKIARHEREFYSQHMRMPDDQEISALVGVPPEKVRMIKEAAATPRAIEEPLGKNSDPSEMVTLGDVLEDTQSAEPEMVLLETSMHRDVDAVLSSLTRRESGIMRMRYGLDDGQPKTLEEIGNAFRVTRERIRQIEMKALAKLQQPDRHSSLMRYQDGKATVLLDGPGWKDGIRRDSSQ